MRGVFFIAACASVLAVALICIFLFANGIPAMKEIGFGKFLTGQMWRPKNQIFGIFPMIIGSLYVTAGAILFGVPVGILTSVFMAHYCPKKIYRPLKAATELLAGIPSVVYGFFGLVVLVPWIREMGRGLGFGGNGSSILTASLLLGMMILPTIIGVTESAIRAVPAQYYEGAVALGATHERAIFRVRSSRDRAWHWPGDRRDDGSHYGGGKPGQDAGRNLPRHPDPDSQYCDRNGICHRPAQGSADCNRRCSLCVHFADQLQRSTSKQEGKP